MKRFIIFLTVLFCSFSLFAFNRSHIRIFTLENGLTLYFLQDTTTAAVRMELNIDAGTSYQNHKNAGLFTLYARLRGLEITPDVVKTEKTVAPAQVERALMELADNFKSLSVSDKKLQEELSLLRTSYSDFSASPAGLINGAIDSRVFPENPWQCESGVNPAVFNQKTISEIRTELNEIQNLYYVPQRSSLYISGNITDSSALALTEKYFGKANEIFSAAQAPSRPSVQSGSQNRTQTEKYVITDDELSPELTQIVLQYTDFSQDEADLIAAVFNNPESEFKRLLIKQKNLAIRAPDYIDASSAQQKNSSRLIIQTLCEKTKVSPLTQGELFLQMATEKNRLPQQELESILKKLNSGFTSVTDNSTLLMKNLAVFNQTNKDFGENLFNKNQRLAAIMPDYINTRFENAKPVMFVLCNTAVYAKYAKDFSKAGYKRVTSKNSFWYRQSQYANLNAKSSRTKTGEAEMDMAASALRFIEENKAQFSEFSLQNNIPVTVKYTPGSKTASISLSIEGGELLFAEKDAGLSSILVNSLASIIQWQLDALTQTGVLKSDASVNAWTGSQYSLLTINCTAEDAPACIECAAASIIFGDITPALADGISYDLRTQWRIKTGSPDFQLLCEAVRNIYSKPFTNLYADKKDKPVQMDFTDIAAAYPLILDCSRFGLVLTGGIQQNDSLHALLENTFGTLGSVKATENIKQKVEKKTLPSKIKKLQLRHQFFTDISADKAGPRPAVLIPTTDFSDPLLYILESPDISSTDCALFNALLYELKERMQKKVSGEQTVKITVPDSDLPYCQITVTKIKHTAVTDRIYTECVRQLMADLENLISRNRQEEAIDLEKDELLARLENLWILHELDKTSDNQGTAVLIQKGKALGNPLLYLDMYKAVSSATAEDFYLVAKAYLPETPALRIYSVDSKK